MSKGRWDRYKNGQRRTEYRVRIKLSAEEFYLFHKKASGAGGIGIEEYMRRGTHYAIEHRARHKCKGSKKSELSRIASLIWGVAAKRYEEYSAIEDDE